MKKNIVIIKGDEQEDRHMQINTSTDYAVRIILYLAKICITVSSSKFAASSSGWCPIEECRSDISCIWTSRIYVEASS